MKGEKKGGERKGSFCPNYSREGYQIVDTIEVISSPILSQLLNSGVNAIHWFLSFFSHRSKYLQ